MNNQTLLHTFLTAGAILKKPMEDLIGRSLHDAYQTTKRFLERKLAGRNEALQALAFATSKPESTSRETALLEETADIDLATDRAFVELIAKIAGYLSASSRFPSTITTHGNNNRIQQAGRDLINTEKIVRRNTITPDERHLSSEQRETLRQLMREVARRLNPTEKSSGLAAIHSMLQRHFGVASYLLIPREAYPAARSLLRQQRAMHRRKLRKLDPLAYRRELFRSIYAGANELGWDQSRLLAYAHERLRKSLPFTSLKGLGPDDLAELAQRVQREVGSHRCRVKSRGR